MDSFSKYTAIRDEFKRGIGSLISKRKFCLLLSAVILCFFLSQPGVNGQILRDTAALKLVKASIQNVYNLHFNEAREDCKKLSLIYPGHAIVYLLNGMITYWKNYPIIPSSPARASFESDLRKCIDLCEGTKNPADVTEFLLTNLSARGLLLVFYTDNDMSKDVFPLAVSTYKYIRRSFDYTSVYTDFYFFTGVYNYYRVAFPEAYPAYRPLAMLFPKGDRQKGLNDLHTAATNSIFLKAEASSFLSLICLSFENNYAQAYEHSKYLHELYPGNIEYLSMFIKNLLLIKKNDEAEKHIIVADSIDSNSFIKAQLSIYKGIVQEKKYHNYKLAEEDYLNGIKQMLPYGYLGNEFAAYAYFGLSRISGINGDYKNKEIYYKKAYDLADFKKVDFN